jgi:23S rRNA pseudouridine1911/1915/1917 synthase
MEIKVLYEDNHLIAVYKPAGVLIQAEDNTHNDDTLYWQLKQFIIKRDNKPGDAFLGVLHRLDRPVSGIVLFAKTSKGAARLSEQFRERTINKYYHALVEGLVEMDEGTLMDTIGKDSSSLRAIIGGGIEEDIGDNAVLHYQVVTRGQKNTLLKIKLETGRFHQIRAQLSAIGHPIVGDKKYGARESFKEGEIALCSTELEFATATTDERVKIEIPYPDIWNILLS